MADGPTGPGIDSRFRFGAVDAEEFRFALHHPDRPGPCIVLPPS